MKDHRASQVRWGTLASDLSKDKIGAANLYVKRDWRDITDGVSVAEGYDWFFPQYSAAGPGTQPFPLADFGDEGPITLIHLCQRQDRRKALVVGTPNGLYRFVGPDEGFAVYEDGVYEDDVYVDDDDFGEWIQIATFDGTGHRWQAQTIEEYTIFNNGVDLPVSYKVTAAQVEPVHELREVGVARLGCTARYSGMLFGGDVSEIKQDVFDEIMSLEGKEDSGDVVATQVAATVTTPTDYFVAPTDTFPAMTAATFWTGRYIEFDDGTERQITGWTDERTVTVGVAGAVGPARFRTYVKATQPGAAFSSPVTGTIAAGGNVVTASAGYFAPGDVGKEIIFTNGWHATIDLFIAANQVRLDEVAPEAWTYAFWMATAANYIVTASAPIFLPVHDGRSIIWQNGEVRGIEEVLTNTTVRVAEWTAAASDEIGLRREDTYDQIATEDCNRFQHRLMWSMYEEPTRFGANCTGSIEAGLWTLTLDHPMESFKAGMEIVIAGAGPNGGNLTATILLVCAGTVLQLDTVAETTVEGALVQASDSIASVTGYDEPRGDYSQIVNMLELAGTLVLYKRQSIILATFTGNVAAPIAFRSRPIPESEALYFKNTLVNVGDNFHLYAASAGFYAFDMSGQMPVRNKQLMLCQKEFYSRASIEQDDYIFGADNGLTQEIWFAVPGESIDRALCWDYGLNGASRTTSTPLTAAATVERVNAVDQWFLMGLDDLTLVVYGLANEPVESWGNAEQIFYRRSAVDGEPEGYEAVLESGLESFGLTYGEKHIAGYQITPHSISPDTLLEWTLLGSNGVSDTATEECSVDYDAMSIGDQIPLHYIRRYFGDRIVKPATIEIDGADVPHVAHAVLTQRTFYVSPIPSEGWTRRV